jgi:hypothetical protein
MPSPNPTPVVAVTVLWKGYQTPGTGASTPITLIILLTSSHRENNNAVTHHSGYEAGTKEFFNTLSPSRQLGE